MFGFETNNKNRENCEVSRNSNTHLNYLFCDLIFSWNTNFEDVFYFYFTLSVKTLNLISSLIVVIHQGYHKTETEIEILFLLSRDKQSDTCSFFVDTVVGKKLKRKT